MFAVWRPFLTSAQKWTTSDREDGIRDPLGEISFERRRSRDCAPPSHDDAAVSLKTMSESLDFTLKDEAPKFSADLHKRFRGEYRFLPNEVTDFFMPIQMSQRYWQMHLSLSA